MKLGLAVDGLKELESEFERIKRESTAQLRREVQVTALKVQGDARKRAPVDMGRLRASIAWKLDETQIAADVGTNVAYAPFVEFGTGPAGAASNLTNLAERARKDLGYTYGPHGGFPPLDVLEAWCRRHGIPNEAAFPIALKIYREGLPAQPFLFPAAEAELEDHVRRIGIALDRALS